MALDIKTTPDVGALRVLHGQGATRCDDEVAQAAFPARQAQAGFGFLQHHLHRLAAISSVFRDNDGLRLRSPGSPEDDEARLVKDFFRVIGR